MCTGLLIAGLLSLLVLVGEKNIGLMLVLMQVLRDICCFTDPNETSWSPLPFVQIEIVQHSLVWMENGSEKHADQNKRGEGFPCYGSLTYCKVKNQQHLKNFRFF